MSPQSVSTFHLAADVSHEPTKRGSPWPPGLCQLLSRHPQRGRNTGSKILTFPMPAIRAQELREDLTNGNSHTAELSGWLSPKLTPENKGYIPIYIIPREVERWAWRMSGEATCWALLPGADKRRNWKAALTSCHTCSTSWPAVSQGEGFLQTYMSDPS